MRLALMGLVALLACGRWGFEPSPEGTDGDASPAGADAAATGPDGAATGVDAAAELDAATARQAVASFTLLPATSAPAARRSSGTAVAADGRIWTFGGFNGSTLNDIGGYSPGTGKWEAPTPSGTVPPQRERHTLAWDESNDLLVVFGGFSGSFSSFTHHDELYIYDPGANTWQQIPKAGNWPVARKDAAMVWVSAADGLLLYGGSKGSGTGDRLTDVWLLSIDTETPSATWTPIDTSGVAPPAQSAACVAYDPIGRRLILHGGESQDGVSAGNTYQYLLDDKLWQLDTTSGDSPGARSFAGCAWDPDIGRVVLYGGQGGSTSPTDGIFVYDPDRLTWEIPPVENAETSPANRSDMGAAYSATLGGVYMFGGRTSIISYTNESWLIDFRLE